MLGTAEFIFCSFLSIWTVLTDKHLLVLTCLFQTVAAILFTQRRNSMRHGWLSSYICTGDSCDMEWMGEGMSWSRCRHRDIRPLLRPFLDRWCFHKSNQDGLTYESPSFIMGCIWNVPYRLRSLGLQVVTLFWGVLETLGGYEESRG